MVAWFDPLPDLHAGIHPFPASGHAAANVGGRGVTDHRPPKQDAALGAAGQLLAFALAALAAAVIAPALLAGTALAYALRRAGLRFTWALPATAVLAIPLILTPGHTLPAVVAVAQDVRHGHVSPAAVVAGLWECWLPLAGMVATAVGARLDRRDRLHGGRAERRARGALGPVGLARRTLARRRAITARDAAQIVLGRDARGHPVLVPSLRAHAMIVGRQRYRQDDDGRQADRW